MNTYSLPTGIQAQGIIFHLKSLLAGLSFIVIGAIISFACFVIMQALIKTEGQMVSAPVIVDVPVIVMQEQEMQVITRTALPEPSLPPKTPLPTRITPSPSEISTTQATISLTNINPPIEVSKQINIQENALSPLIRVPPKYPFSAAQEGIEGFVRLEFSIAPNGTVVDINVIEAFPRGVFEREATKALRKWKYQPQIQNGVATKVSGLQVQLDFNMQGSS